MLSSEFHKLFKGGFNLLNDRIPFAMLLLPKDAHGEIQGAVHHGGSAN